MYLLIQVHRPLSLSYFFISKCKQAPSCCWDACVGAEGQHLVISPRQTQIKTSGSGVIFTCTLTEYDTSLTPTMSWQSPQHTDISSTRGR